MLLPNFFANVSNQIRSPPPTRDWDKGVQFGRVVARGLRFIVGSLAGIVMETCCDGTCANDQGTPPKSSIERRNKPSLQLGWHHREQSGPWNTEIPAAHWMSPSLHPNFRPRHMGEASTLPIFCDEDQVAAEFNPGAADNRALNLDRDITR